MGPVMRRVTVTAAIPSSYTGRFCIVMLTSGKSPTGLELERCLLCSEASTGASHRFPPLPPEPDLVACSSVRGPRRLVGRELRLMSIDLVSQELFAFMRKQEYYTIVGPESAAASPSPRPAASSRDRRPTSLLQPNALHSASSTTRRISAASRVPPPETQVFQF